MRGSDTTPAGRTPEFDRVAEHCPALGAQLGQGNGHGGVRHQGAACAGVQQGAHWQDGVEEMARATAIAAQLHGVPRLGEHVPDGPRALLMALREAGEEHGRAGEGVAIGVAPQHTAGSRDGVARAAVKGLKADAKVARHAHRELTVIDRHSGSELDGVAVTH